MKYFLPACLAVAAFLPAQTPDALNQEYRDWRQDHPYPTSTDHAPLKKYGAALLKASDGWIQKYPGEFMPLHERFIALDMMEASKGELESAGDALLRTSNAPVRMHVARVWLKRDIRVSEIPELVEKGLEMSAESTGEASIAARMNGWGLIAEAWLKLDQPFKARTALDRMHDWLEKNKPAHPTPVYAGYQAQYYERMAAFAEKTGSKLDALTYLERAMATGRLSAAQVERARALWKEMGGSNEGWLVFSAPPVVTAAMVNPAAPRPASRAEIGKPLPELNLSDLHGNTWTLANFQGKTTLVNVWATWCGPCRRELPHLQKLYGKLKDRQDVQVITFNVDEDVKLVEPYLKKNKYTFPVVPARTYVHKLLPSLSIPRNWIVDDKGMMREEAIGFGGDGNQWVENALAKLQH